MTSSMRKPAPMMGAQDMPKQFKLYQCCDVCGWPIFRVSTLTKVSVLPVTSNYNFRSVKCLAPGSGMYHARERLCRCRECRSATTVVAVALLTGRRLRMSFQDLSMSPHCLPLAVCRMGQQHDGRNGVSERLRRATSERGKNSGGWGLAWHLPPRPEHAQT